MALTESSLLCHEVLDVSDLQKTPPPNNNQRQQIYPEMPPTVKAVEDLSQLRDDRVLQNLLRNEEKYLPVVPDYMRNIQTCITPSMRKIVADWMLEVVHEQNSQPEVFYLAMNIVDRFLCRCRIMKSQLQLLGTVAILISSKIREPCPIPGKTLITYTDYSITADELKEWELLVLYKLQWEITAITPLDYLDHVLPRLCLGESVSAADLNELRRRTETILVLCATEYKFAYHSPSLLAASRYVNTQCTTLFWPCHKKPVILALNPSIFLPFQHPYGPRESFTVQLPRSRSEGNKASAADSHAHGHGEFRGKKPRIFLQAGSTGI